MSQAVLTFATLEMADTDTKIAANVTVPCPKKVPGKQVNRLAAQCCPDCEFFEGIGMLTVPKDACEKADILQAIERGELKWPQCYAIRCHTVMEWVCGEISD